MLLFTAKDIAMKTMLLGLLFYSFSLFSAEPPATQLAAIYQGHEAISDYLVSEKYDGVSHEIQSASLLQLLPL